jgi:hypothetical protein
MGRKPIWTPEDIKNFKEHTVLELRKIYPDKSYQYLREIKRYYMERQPKQPSNPDEPSGRLYKTWETSAFNKETGEWETAVNHGYEYTNNKDVDDLFPQVERAKITPTRRKRAKRLGSLILGYGDGQVDFRIIRDPRTLETEVVPLQNVPMHRIILQMNAHYQPEITLNGGDFSDFSASSRFPADSDHFNGSMTLAMQWIHDFYAQMVADNPNAVHREVASNHSDRPRKRILKEAPEFYNFYRPGEDYPAWTYYSMARLGELGIVHSGGYPEGGYLHGDPEYPQILWKHGVATGKNAVYQEADRNPTLNVIRWHNHGERMLKRTTRDGNQLFYLILGSSCVNGGPVPGYSNAVDDFNQPVPYHNQDHVNSFVIVRDYGQGRYEPVTIDVVNGKAFYDGIEWDGHTPYEWEKRYGYIKESNDGK